MFQAPSFAGIVVPNETCNAAVYHAGSDMDYMANGETQIRGCDYTGYSCDSYTFSYELVDTNSDDNIDIKITDGADCDASTAAQVATVAHYTDHGQEDVVSAKFYDFTIDPAMDSSQFCIFVTCDNAFFGCDELTLKIKMTCNTASNAPRPPITSYVSLAAASTSIATVLAL